MSQYIRIDVHVYASQLIWLFMSSAKIFSSHCLVTFT